MDNKNVWTAILSFFLGGLAAVVLVPLFCCCCWIVLVAIADAPVRSYSNSYTDTSYPMMGNSQSSLDYRDYSAPTPVATPVANAVVYQAKLNETADLTDYTVKVSQAISDYSAKQVNSQNSTALVGTHLVAVYVEFTNTSDNYVVTGAYDFGLFDCTNKCPARQVDVTLEKPLFPKYITLAPGEKAEGWIFYTAQNSAKEYALNFPMEGGNGHYYTLKFN